MDDHQLTELERLERAASPRPWISWAEERGGLGGDSFIQSGGGDTPDIYVDVRVSDTWHPAATADADFIAAARNAIPDLIAEVRRLRAR